MMETEDVDMEAPVPVPQVAALPLSGAAAAGRAGGHPPPRRTSQHEITGLMLAGAVADAWQLTASDKSHMPYTGFSFPLPAITSLPPVLAPEHLPADHRSYWVQTVPAGDQCAVVLLHDGDMPVVGVVKSDGQLHAVWYLGHVHLADLPRESRDLFSCTVAAAVVDSFGVVSVYDMIMFSGVALAGDATGIRFGKRWACADKMLKLLRSVWNSAPQLGEHPQTPPNITLAKSVDLTAKGTAAMSNEFDVHSVAHPRATGLWLVRDADPLRCWGVGRLHWRRFVTVTLVRFNNLWCVAQEHEGGAGYTDVRQLLKPSVRLIAAPFPTDLVRHMEMGVFLMHISPEPGSPVQLLQLGFMDRRTFTTTSFGSRHAASTYVCRNKDLHAAKQEAASKRAAAAMLLRWCSGVLYCDAPDTA